MPSSAHPWSVKIEGIFVTLWEGEGGGDGEGLVMPLGRDSWLFWS